MGQHWLFIGPCSLQVTFQRPVEVGDLLQLRCHVLHTNTRHDLGQVRSGIPTRPPMHLRLHHTMRLAFKVNGCTYNCAKQSPWAYTQVIYIYSRCACVRFTYLKVNGRMGKCATLGAGLDVMSTIDGRKASCAKHMPRAYTRVRVCLTACGLLMGAAGCARGRAPSTRR